MRRYVLITLALSVALFSLFSTSCKKTKKEATRPTPANNRLLSYSKFSTSSGSLITTQENFTFFYNGSQRVTQILYSTNDPARVTAGTSDESIIFTYSNDSIYKVTTAVKTSIVMERDTFLQNSSGYIIQAFTPGMFNTFQYNGKLIALNSKSVYDSGTSISATSQYTSDNGDLLNHTYNGILQANFPDSGLSFYIVAHDTALTPPLTVTWTDFGGTWTSTVHTTGGYSDQLTGYTTGDPVAIQAVDPYGVVAYDTVIWPGGIWNKESFYVYPDLVNRTGDYLQIESFTKYGFNLYQDAHLIRQIVEQNGPTTNVTYTIDADSKITQTSVTTTDLFLNTSTAIYKFQYEVF